MDLRCRRRCRSLNQTVQSSRRRVVAAGSTDVEVGGGVEGEGGAEGVGGAAGAAGVAGGGDGGGR